MTTSVLAVRAGGVRQDRNKTFTILAVARLSLAVSPPLLLIFTFEGDETHVKTHYLSHFNAHFP